MGSVVRIKSMGDRLRRRSGLHHFASIEGLKPRRRWQGLRLRWAAALSASVRMWRWWSNRFLRVLFPPVLLLIGCLAAVVYFSLAGLPLTLVRPNGFEVVPATHFALCDRPPHQDCVIDGDTFYLRNQSVRIADIDAPETHPPRCVSEGMLGARATTRLLRLLDMRTFELWPIDRDEDIYGRKLRKVVQDGRSVGGILVSEGLARKWTGRRMPWCDTAS
jgi:endonuclease YncB( thermonuclease family)